MHYIKSNKELNKLWLTYINGKPVIKKAVKALIDKCAEEANATHIIATGSSMGGFCALYYGLKYDYDIISGSPLYTLTDMNQIMYAVGGAGKVETDWFNEQIHSVIRNA